MNTTSSNNLRPRLTELIDRLLQLLPRVRAVVWQDTPAAIWRSSRWSSMFVSHQGLDSIGLGDLIQVDDQKDKLIQNTQQFIAGLPANNALLWGARGTGKSSLIHALLNQFQEEGLRLIEVSKTDLVELPDIVSQLADQPFRFVLFCDDLSFEPEDASYKELKSALEGSVFKTARNVLIYATSNRRHLVPEYMSDNTQARMVEGELHEAEVVEEKISLSDRFGLWLSFYPFKQDAYLVIVRHWVGKLAAEHGLELDVESDALRAEALRWALARGVRSGRTAQYFARDWVGRSGLKVTS